MAELWARVSTGENWRYTALRVVKGRFIGGEERFTREAVERQHRRKEVWESVRDPGGAARYCLKYAAKARQKSPPTWFADPGRFVGHSSGIVPGDGVDFSATEAEVRELAAALGRNLGHFEVLPKYIWYNGDLTRDCETDTMPGLSYDL